MTWYELFKTAYQIGLTPEQVLDLTFWQFKACSEGYSERTKDEMCQQVVGAYYTAYYSNAKHPKSPARVIKQILNTGDYEQEPNYEKRERHEVNMEEEIALYEERERRFREMGVHV